MAQWIFLNELEQARSLYLDAYRGKHGFVSPMIERHYWDDMNWLEQETERLVLNAMKGRVQKQLRI